MRLFWCLVTILNTKDHLGKFDGKADEGFFVGYSLNSKAFRVFNNRTRIVEENLHIKFSENTPNIVRRNQSNGNACTKSCDDACKARMEIVLGKDYILLSTNNVNVVGTNEVNVVGANTNNKLPFDLEMSALEEIRTFNFLSNHENDVEEADMNNMDTTIQVSPTPTTRIHKDHRLDQVIGDLHSTTQTRNMSKNLEEHSKAFRVFNNRTRIVEENLHIKFRNQSNGNACTKACDDACKARMEIVLGKDYILLPLWIADPLIS
nr:retrovirus-related Pol polyprotein from transposon TNT 1-94 [Tanacetum cinerariifolium]